MLNLEQHLIRQMAFSKGTFGPGQRQDGVIDHIRKELTEIEEECADASEWVDVVLLALDGLTRRLRYVNGVGPENEADPREVARIAANMIDGTQTRNEMRVWPDWRQSDPNKAIEHDRSKADRETFHVQV